MLTLDQIRLALKPYNLSKVAKEAGVNKHTLYRMMNEQHKPSYETVKLLSDYLL
jgi:DNA-binding phage protein